VHGPDAQQLFLARLILVVLDAVGSAERDVVLGEQLVAEQSGQRVEAQLGRLQRRWLPRWRGSFEICARHVAELLLGGRELALGGRVALVRRRRRREPRDEELHHGGAGAQVVHVGAGAQGVLVLATGDEL